MTCEYGQIFYWKNEKFHFYSSLYFAQTSTATFVSAFVLKKMTSEINFISYNSMILSFRWSNSVVIYSFALYVLDILL